MIVAVGVLAVLAALLHVYIFILESFRWNVPSTRRVFGVSAEQATTLAPMAYNQGFYNLFLAIVTLTGVTFLDSREEVAVALLLAGTGSMLAAAVVLVTHDKRMMRAALIQGTLPALTILSLFFAI